MNFLWQAILKLLKDNYFQKKKSGKIDFMLGYLIKIIFKKFIFKNQCTIIHKIYTIIL